MVYHYTSPDGLYAILKYHSVRFTDCQYMNDKSEFMYIKEPLLNALKECENDLKYKHYKDLINIAFTSKYGYDIVDYTPPNKCNPKGMLTQSEKRHYIFCASTSDDSLGMWNYYVKGENFQGYNIGFNTDKLVEEAINKSSGSYFYDLNHQEVIYDEKKQIDLLAKILRKIDDDIFCYASEYGMAEFDKLDENSMANIIFSGRLDFSCYRLLFKHPAFADEREYRFILSISNQQITEHSSIFKKDYFVRNGIITPCCTLIFVKDSIIDITISPTMELDLVEHSTRNFLKENEYTNIIKIRQSKIPIRY